MKEESKFAFCLGLLGGVLYAKILIWALGIWMALPTLTFLKGIGEVSWTFAQFLDGLLVSILCFSVIALPIGYALRFLFPTSAVLGGASVALGAFLFIYLPDPFSLWYVFRANPSLVSTQHIVFFGGPALAAWILSRTRNNAFNSDTSKAGAG